MATLLAAGAGLPSHLANLWLGTKSGVTFDLLVGLGGFWMAFGAVTPMVRAFADTARLRAAWGRAGHDRFVRSSIAQQVFQLLFAVARARGSAGPAERELVRRFLLERFLEPAQAEELRRWESEVLPPQDVAALARTIRRSVDEAECATLFSWCCLIANADGDLHVAERATLERVAHGLGIEPAYARFLLLLANEARRREARGRAGATTGSGAGSAAGATNARGRRTASATTLAPDERELALRTLDLPAEATREMIRKRHRELVRRFHPDAQPHLGPIAMREATERFRAIQRAYEVLTQ